MTLKHLAIGLTASLLIVLATIGAIWALTPAEPKELR